MESVQQETLLCITSHAAATAISSEGKNSTLKNQKREMEVQLTTALNVKSECITDKHSHKY
jgi:hypothetical protein